MSAKKHITMFAIFSLISFMFLSQGQCLAFNRGLKGALEDALSDKDKKSDSQTVDKDAPSASSYDPEKGTTTTVQHNPDGSETKIISKSWEDEDGTQYTLDVDNEGNQLKTVTEPNGTKTTTFLESNGNKTRIVEEKDGTKTIYEETADGYFTETTVNDDGTTTTVKRDHDGNVLETINTHPGGKVTVTDSKGVVRQSRTTEDGITRSVTTDKDGNRYELVTDSEGNILHEREVRKTNREPGQEYFETVLGGQIGEWDELPQSFKTRYANSERQAKERGERLALLDSQAAERQNQADENSAWQAGQMEAMDEELAKIEAQRQEHLERRQMLLAQQEADTAQAELDLARMDAKSKSDELQGQLNRALKSGDREEIRRIENLMDEHHDATAHLFEFTPEEQVQMERYQQARDFARDEIMKTVMADPLISRTAQIERRIGIEGLHDTWRESNLRELTFTGIAMNEVEDGAYRSQESIIRANIEIKASQEYLQRGDLTPYQRRAGEQMLENAISERAHAFQGLVADGEVVLLGAAFDVGTVAAGGVVSKLLGKFVRPSLLKGAERTKIFASTHLGPKAAKGVEIATETAVTDITKIPGSIKEAALNLRGGTDDAARTVAADAELWPGVKSSDLTPAQRLERQLRHDARARRPYQEGTEGFDGGDDTVLISQTEQPLRPRTNLTPEEVQRILDSDTLTRQELIDKTEILAQRAKLRNEILQGGRRVNSQPSQPGGQQSNPPWNPGPSDSAITEGRTIIGPERTPHGTAAPGSRPPEVSVPGSRPPEVSVPGSRPPGRNGPGGTEVLRPDETFIDRGETGRFPEFEPPSGEAANPVAETLQVIADEPMNPPSGTQAPPVSEGRPPTPPRGPKQGPTTPPKVPKETPPKPPKDEPDIQLYDDDGSILTNQILKQRRLASKELSAALDKYYRHGELPMDPMHVLNRKTINKVISDGRLTTGDINFSAENVGPLRLGGEAIRRRPGSENLIHFIKGDARGWGVKYFRNGIEYLPDGSVDLSKGHDYIPIELLQRFDRKIGRWVDF